MRARSLIRSLTAWADPFRDGAAAAIATIGVLAGNLFRSDLRPLEADDLKPLNEVESLTACLDRFLKETTSQDRLYPRRLRWGLGDGLSDRWLTLQAGITPRIAAESWRSLVARRGRQTLQCPASHFTEEDATELFRELHYIFSRPDVDIESIYFEWWRMPVGTSDVSGKSAWNWPLAARQLRYCLD